MERVEMDDSMNTLVIESSVVAMHDKLEDTL